MSSAPRPRPSVKESKVQLRLRPAQKELITQAAHLKQTTITNFVVEHAMTAAQQVLADQVNFELSPQLRGILQGSGQAAKGNPGALQASQR